MLLWRISNHPGLDGRGGLETSARWHSQGRPIVYLAESVAAALLEMMVHLELSPFRLPRSYRLLKLEAPEAIATEEVSADDLAVNWTEEEILTRTVGDQWLAANRTALLRVPSAIAPETFNVLMNPAHAAARSVKVVWHREYRWDLRLISHRRE